MAGDAYTHEVTVQYRDLDPRSHVNHAVYVSYMEQAKGRFMADEFGTALEDAGTVIRHLEVDYVAPVEPGATVAVTIRPVEAGETSFTLAYELTVSGTVVATGRTVSVRLGADGPEPLPEAWRAALGDEGA